MLAFACAFTMFAGAAFTDEADINADNRDAVELLTALNIIKGYEDGSFDPEGTVDRAEMAKMIYTIRNGGNDDASAYETVTTTFQDINGHWAEGYIKYLQNTGIVAGKSATRFDPDSQVTTGEAMKMALALAGYDETNAGLTGAGWLNNTVSMATTVGMTKDVQSAIASGCSRQDAAQILANTLIRTGAVRWSAIVEDFVPDSKSGLAYSGNWITVGEKWMDLAVADGWIEEGPSSKTNPKTVVFHATESWTNEDGETVRPGVVTFNDTTIDVTDLAGYEVTAVWNSSEEDEVDGVYGFYKTDDNASWETMWKSIEQDGTRAAVKFDGDSVDVESLAVYANGYDTNYRITGLNQFDKDNVADLVTFIDNDGDGNIDALQYTTQNVAKVTYVDSNKLNTTNLIGDVDATPVNWFDTTANGGEGYVTNPNLDDVITYDGIAKDDYVKVTYDYYNDKVAYEKIDVVEATVEATRTSQGTKEIRIDGNWYKAAAGYTLPSIVTGDSIAYVAIDNLLYNVEKLDGIWGSKNLAMVYNVQQYRAGVNQYELEIALIDRNGDKITGILDEYNNVEVKYTSGNEYTIDTDWDGQIDSSETYPISGTKSVAGALTNVLVTYRQSGNSISLMPVGATNLSDGDGGVFEYRQLAGYDDIYKTDGKLGKNMNVYELDEDVNTVTSSVYETSATTKNISDDAVVFVYDANAGSGHEDAVVINGSDLKEWADNSVEVYADAVNPVVVVGNTVNGVDYIQAIAIGMDVLPTATGNNYALVLNADETSYDGEDNRHFELWTNNGLLDAYEVNSDLYQYDGGEIVTYNLVSTGERTIISDVTPVKMTSADNKNATLVGHITSDGFYNNGNSIAINGYAYDLAADCTVINVDTTGPDGVSYGADAIAQAFEASKKSDGITWIDNVVYVVGNDGDLVFVMIDTQNNKIDDPTLY